MEAGTWHGEMSIVFAAAVLTYPSAAALLPWDVSALSLLRETRTESSLPVVATDGFLQLSLATYPALSQCSLTARVPA